MEPVKLSVVAREDFGNIRNIYEGKKCIEYNPYNHPDFGANWWYLLGVNTQEENRDNWYGVKPINFLQILENRILSREHRCDHHGCDCDDDTENFAHFDHTGR